MHNNGLNDYSLRDTYGEHILKANIKNCAALIK
nr:MAG TPA: hypothetical protein [Caudoviricetes sp.]